MMSLPKYSVLFFSLILILSSCSNEIKKRSVEIVEIIDVNPEKYSIGHSTRGLIIGLQLSSNDEQIELKFKDIQSYVTASLIQKGTEITEEGSSWGSCASSNVTFSFNTRIYTLPPNSTMVFYSVFEDIHSEIEGTTTINYFDKQEDFVFKELKDSLGIKYQGGFSVGESLAQGCQ